MTKTWVSDKMELSVYGHLNQSLNLLISKLLGDFFVVRCFGFGFLCW